MRFNRFKKRNRAANSAGDTALRRSEEKFRKIFNYSNDAIFVIDPSNDRIIDFNPKASEMLGYAADELCRIGISQIHPDEMPKLMKFSQAVMQTGFGWTDELSCVTKNGSSVPSEISASVIEIDGRNHIITIVRDITERKLAEKAIREREERFSGILESALDSIITIDRDWHIRIFNKAAESIFRCRANEVLDQSLERFLTEGFQKVLAEYMRATEAGTATQRYMWTPDGLTARRASGEEFPIEATISRAQVSGQELYTIILRDIDDRKHAEEELGKLQLENVYLQEEIKAAYNFEEIIGASAAMQGVFRHIEKVAATDATVLISGETGTGKELIARAIHNRSTRREKPLIKVNCAALPGGLIESELFGHEKGAFTGASAQKKGRFELADQATIFLDEVGELPLETQSKLLRVLQEQEFERVGGTRTLRVDARVIAATNRDLEEAVKVGSFRADLFYRLNIFPIALPLLRERKEDIPILTHYFVDKFAHRMGKKVTEVAPKAIDRLKNYSWPGNVRELANIIERAVILCDCETLRAEHLAVSDSLVQVEPGIASLEEIERRHIVRALEQTHGKVGGEDGAAKLLGLNRTTLISRMKKLAISMK